MKFSKESNSEKETDSDKEANKILGRFGLLILGFFILIILL